MGGDGMFSELLHGLIGRTQQEAGLSESDPTVALQPCPLHMGIIPAGYCSWTIQNVMALDFKGVTREYMVSILGSTDCVCYATVGVIDPVTSALHIIIGE